MPDAPNTEAQAETGDWFTTESTAFRLSDIAFVASKEVEVTRTERQHTVVLHIRESHITHGITHDAPVRVSITPELFERLKARLTGKSNQAHGKA